MSTKTLLSLATIAFFAATAKADGVSTVISTTESTSDWFTISTPINADTAPENPVKQLLAGIANASTNGASRIEITGQLTSLVLNAGAPSGYTSEYPQAAIVGVDDTNDRWYAWRRTGASAGSWVEMTGTAGGDYPTPEEGHAYGIIIEFNTTSVRYGVVVESNPVVWLTANDVTDSSGWMTKAGSLYDIAAVALAGYGTMSASNGFAIKTVTIDTDKIAEASSAYDDVTAGNLDEKVSDSAKLTRRQAILLGLPSPLDNPVPAPVQTGDDFLGFTISNADLDKYGTDAYVTLEVYEVEDPSDDISAGTLKGSGSADGTVKVSPEKSGVRYYKTKIIFH